MRMWHIPAAQLCDVHLRAEHRELHCLVVSVQHALDPTWPRQRQHHRSIEGLVARGYLNLSPVVVRVRHDQLTLEARARGRKWDSPLSAQPLYDWDGLVAVEGGDQIQRDRRELAERCPRCKLRMAR